MQTLATGLIMVNGSTYSSSKTIAGVMVLSMLAMGRAETVRSSSYEDMCGQYKPETFSNTSTVAGRSTLECANECTSDQCCTAFSFDKLTNTCSLSDQTSYVCSADPLPDGTLFHQVKLPVSVRCPPDWSPYDYGCYHFMPNVNLNREGAAAACAELGAHLVSVQSQGEMDFLGISAMASRGVSNPNEAGKWWTGAQRDPDSDWLVDENWFWDGLCSDEQSMATYHPWLPDEPDNLKGEQYYCYLDYDGYWGFVDKDVEKQCQAICEY